MTATACIDGHFACRTCGQTKPCTEFGAADTPRGHRLQCSDCTRSHRTRQRHAPQPGQPVPCYWCGTRFVPTRDRKTYCSYNCAYAGNSKPDACKVHINPCKGCGLAFSARRRRRYCTHECRPEKVWQRNDRCPKCGNEREFLKTYCKPCIQAAGKQSRKRAKHRRRALEHGALTERIDTQVVYDRDGWTCGICRKPVDASLAYPDPLSPSLDHVVPLAMNGSHTYLNVQLAHLRCNLDKRASPPRIKGKVRPDHVLF